MEWEEVDKWSLSYLCVKAYDMLYSENVQYAVPEIILLYIMVYLSGIQNAKVSNAEVWEMISNCLELSLTSKS